MSTVRAGGRLGRPFISPNEGFLLQLAMFEYETLGGLSVSSRTSKHWNFYAINE